jgi:hypothetical protein
MAYSGTTSQTVFDTRKVIDSAVRRCKLPAQKITSEMIEIANNELYLFLSQLANQQAPLWCTTKTIYPLYDGVADIATVTGTVDVYEALLRSQFEVTGMSIDVPASRTYTFEGPMEVSTVGILWAGPSKPVVLSRSVDNIVWQAVPVAPAVGSAGAGQWIWYDLASIVPTTYFKVETADFSLLSYTDIYLGHMPSEIPLSRLNRDDYVNLPNKTFTSNRPLQYWLDRQVRVPVMRLWPMPNAQAGHSQLVVWSHRHIMDVGDMTQEIEVPQRWYDAVVAGLAARMAQELPEVDPGMVGTLDAKALMTLQIAQGEERDNSTKRIAPDFSAYTA